MVILGLGSNLGDRAAILQTALAEMRGWLRDMRVSTIIESEALLPEGAPASWNIPFYNMAVCGETEWDAAAILTAIKDIEHRLGRRKIEHWSPREIDIDILALDGIQLNTPELCIPHKELLNRDFALLPLAEIAPDWLYPLEGIYKNKRAADIVREKNFTCRNTGIKLHAA